MSEGVKLFEEMGSKACDNLHLEQKKVSLPAHYVIYIVSAREQDMSTALGFHASPKEGDHA
jgi:hypothetical protein